ncbi:MAG: hypothetical protein Q9217_005232 [Psora testacea]
MNRSDLVLSPLTTIPPSPSSYIYPTTSIPTTPSLLSRSNSATRLRHSQSYFSIPTTSQSTSSLRKPTDDTISKSSTHLLPFGVQSNTKRRRKIRPTNGSEDDWITRTASTLTLSRLEEKGQSWLVARESSTSLTGIDADDEYNVDSPDYTRSQFVSARTSKTKLVKSRRGSAANAEGTKEGSAAGCIVGPDFVNVEDEEEMVGNDGEEGEEVNEGEMKKVVMGRIGGWVDWAVGWMDFRVEEEEEDEDRSDRVEQTHEPQNDKGLDVEEVKRRLELKKRRLEGANEDDADGGVSVPLPPEGQEASLVNDAKWLLRVASKIVL